MNRFLIDKSFIFQKNIMNFVDLKFNFYMFHIYIKILIIFHFGEKNGKEKYCF